MKNAASIPLYLYAKAPVVGQVKQRLCPPLSPKQAAQVAQALLLQAADTVDSGWPGQCVLSVSPDLEHPDFQVIRQSNRWQTAIQLQTDLGGRMCDTLERGIAIAGAAAILGTDIPTLTNEVLQQAHALLAQGRQVVGPSADGGFYFIGMTQSPRSLFNGIRWGSSTVYAKLMENARANKITLEPLPVLSDCDYFKELQVAAETTPAFLQHLAKTGFDLSLLNLR